MTMFAELQARPIDRVPHPDENLEIVFDFRTINADRLEDEWSSSTRYQASSLITGECPSINTIPPMTQAGCFGKIKEIRSVTNGVYYILLANNAACRIENIAAASST